MHINKHPLCLFAQPPHLGLHHYLKGTFQRQCLHLYLWAYFFCTIIQLMKYSYDWRSVAFVVDNCWPIILISFKVASHSASINLCSHWLVGERPFTQPNHSFSLSRACCVLTLLNIILMFLKETNCLSQLYHRNPAHLCVYMYSYGNIKGVL